MVNQKNQSNIAERTAAMLMYFNRSAKQIKVDYQPETMTIYRDMKKRLDKKIKGDMNA
jgi:hypothetical protein